MELHDTAEYQLQISDGGKVIHDEHAVVHYCGADDSSCGSLGDSPAAGVPQF